MRLQLRIPKVDAKVLIFFITLMCVLYFTAYPTARLLWNSLFFQGTLTLQNYWMAFSSTYMKALTNSAICSFASSLLATLAGIILAFLAVRTDAPFKRLTEISVLVPFMTSPLISAIAWSLLGNPTSGALNRFFKWLLNTDTPLFNIYGYLGIILVLGIYATPFVYMLVSTSLRLMNPELEEAASAAGSSTLGAVLHVTLPLMLPSLVAGFIMAFVSGMEHISIPTILGVPAGIQFYAPAIAFTIRSQIGFEFAERMALASSLSVVLLALTVTLLLFQLWLLRRKEFTTVTGRGFRPRLIELGRWKWLAGMVSIVYFLGSTILPYSVLILVSFTKYVTFNLAEIARTLTLSNYNFVLFEYPITSVALENSILTSVLAATIGLGLSTIVSFILVRTKMRGKGLMEAFTWLPTATPSVVLGIMLAYVYLRPPFVLYGTIWVLVIAYMTKFFPMGIKSVSSVQMRIHQELEESSLTCGASFMQTFRRILFPLIVPGLVAGWSLLFIEGFRELSSSLILASGPTITISVALFDLWSEGLWSQISALSVIMTSFMVATILIVQKILKVNIFGTQ